MISICFVSTNGIWFFLIITKLFKTRVDDMKNKKESEEREREREREITTSESSFEFKVSKAQSFRFSIIRFDAKNRKQYNLKFTSFYKTYK